MLVGAGVMRLALATFALMGISMPAIANITPSVDAWSQEDYEAAVKEWRKSAMVGDADAQFNLGQAYRLGQAVKADLNIAREWYCTAAAQGHLQAADSCGHLLHRQNKISEALPFLIASADRGKPRAQYLLATELFSGVYIGKDRIRAYALMTHASSSGLAEASRSLAEMNKHIPVEQRNAALVLAGVLIKRAHSVNIVRSAPTKRVAIEISPSVQTLPPASVPPTAARDVAIASASNAQQTRADKAWRIQLGAFSNPENARRFWQKVTGDVAKLSDFKPIMNTGTTFTRLQTGDFDSKADADAMCAKLTAIGQQCLAVPNPEFRIARLGT
jgi:uncharacterized protein